MKNQNYQSRDRKQGKIWSYKVETTIALIIVTIMIVESFIMFQTIFF